MRPVWTVRTLGASFSFTWGFDLGTVPVGGHHHRPGPLFGPQGPTVPGIAVRSSRRPVRPMSTVSGRRRDCRHADGLDPSGDTRTVGGCAGLRGHRSVEGSDAPADPGTQLPSARRGLQGTPRQADGVECMAEIATTVPGKGMTIATLIQRWRQWRTRRLAVRDVPPWARGAEKSQRTRDQW